MVTLMHANIYPITFWKYWFKLWTHISESYISDFAHFEGCVLFSFPVENKLFNVMNF